MFDANEQRLFAIIAKLQYHNRRYYYGPADCTMTPKMRLKTYALRKVKSRLYDTYNERQVLRLKAMPAHENISQELQWDILSAALRAIEKIPLY